MKGVIVIGLMDGEAMHVCNNCWDGGAKRLYDNTLKELEEQGLPTAFTPTKGPIAHCDVCKRTKKEDN